MSTDLHDLSTAVAVIGLSGRFPGAAGVEQFWRNLREGVESISFFDKEELRAAGFKPAMLDHPKFVPARGVLEGADLFDAAFFAYTPREAQMMDPQQRLFLECGYHALENAGYDGETFEGSIGVYAGVSVNSYLLSHVLTNPEIAYSLGTDKDFLATRLSYKLNLRGPSITIQTACSTSLVAICHASQALLDYHCDMAIAGGATIGVPQKAGYVYHEGGIMSPDGHCRAFDASARGTVTGDGVGVVVLKRLADAFADGDTIHAIVRGFALNNDGAGKIGYTAPSIDGQAHAIAMAQSLAGVDPDTITYVETHGTATELGDPIEIAALTKAFRASTSRKGFCRIGSVKTNIGHLDATAGVAGFIKTVLALEHREIPPSLHFERPNPKIDFENSPFRVATQLTEWPAGPEPRRAGVSSFGIGGTNAHVVLEEAPRRPPSGPSRPWQVLPLSARSDAALESMSDRLAAHLERDTQTPLADVAHTLQSGRRRFAHRRIAVGRTGADTAAALASRTRRRVVSRVQEAGDRPVVFMFPGQGTQRPGMARGVYEQEPAFRRAFDACADRLAPLLGLDLRRVLYGTEAPGGAELLTGPRVVQSALFATEYALAQMWMAWGIKPQAMIGHSIGEYVAACLSGVLTLEDALPLIAERGRLMEEAPPGVMTAVPLPAAEVRDLLEPDLWLSAINAPSLCVVAGAGERVETFEARLSDGGIECHRLQTAAAFHSGLMAGIVEPLTAAARRVRVGRPSIPYISNVTGTWIGEAELSDSGYWARQARECVQFEAGVNELMTFGGRVFLEVGPGQVLGTLVRQCLMGQGRVGDVSLMASLPYVSRDVEDGESIATALGELWLSGANPDWKAYRGDERRHRVELPEYPFERKRYWVVRRKVASVARGRATVDEALYAPSWKRATLLAPAAAPPDCLVFAHENGAGEALVQRLRARGSRVRGVRPGAAFRRVSEAEWTVRPDARADYDSLLADVRASGGWPGTIVHALGLTAPGAGTHDDGSTAAQLALGFYSGLYLAQALADAVTPGVRLVFITDGVHDVTGDETLHPAKAAVLGVCRVAPQELAAVTCRHLDLDTAEAMAPRSGLLDDLVTDLAGGSEPVVAYRGRHRWSESVERLALPAHEGLPARVRSRGTYLVTGGLGGIGLVVARHLAEAAQARLVLVGRRGLPSRADWDDVLASRGHDDPVCRCILAVREMERAGGEVMVSAADATDERSMRGVVDEARARFGAIHGVIHAAGVPGGGVIQLRTQQSAAAVLAPKVEGTLVLERVLGAGLDFSIICSSLASLVGGAGQVDYCAANAFQDAYARRRTTRDGALTVSIAWDTWAEAGMAVNAQLPPALQKGRADAIRRGLTSNEGVEILRRVLSGPSLPQVLVSLDDLGTAPAVSATPAEPAEETAATAEDENGAPSHPRPNLPHAFVPPADETEQRVCALWESTLGVRPIGTRDSFFELGGHSLLAVNLMLKFNAQFGTAIPVARLYEGLTPAFLADLIREENVAPPDETQELLSTAREPLAHREEIRRRRLEARRTERRGV
jgi:acyl transferase domain-containing protein